MGGVTKVVSQITSIPLPSGGGGGGGGFFGSIGDFISAPFKQAEIIVNQIIKNPLPLIETAGLISVGVPPSVASASVTAMNGGSVKDIVNAGIVAYGADYVAGKVSSQLPTDTSATTVKIVSSAAGADAATTIKSLANGKNIGDALNDGLNAGVAAGAGTAAGGLVDNKIGAGAAAGAASGATTAALTGKDIGSAALTGAEQGAIKPATDVALGAAKDALGNIPTPDLTGGFGDTFSKIKETVDPYLTAAKDVIKPYYDPISGAVSNISQSAKKTAAPYYDAISGVEIPNNALTQAVGQAPNLYHDNQVMAQMAKTPNVPAPASAGATGSESTTGSPAAYGAGDVAMLDATTPEGMGSKMGKKGGKYPWGDPEGTTALKQEGQVV